MARILTKTTQVMLDLFALAVAFGLAFVVRFDWQLPYLMLKRLVFTAPYVVALQYFVLAGFGVPRFAWRYVGLREAIRMFLALFSVNLLLLFMRLALGGVAENYPPLRHGLIPIGVIAIDFAAAFFGVSGLRILRRIVAERVESKHLRDHAANHAVPTILIGAGQAGLMVAKEITSRPDLGIRPVGFVDDDPVKVGTVLHGLRVLGPTTAIAELCHRYGAEQALITIANAPGKEIRRVMLLCEEAGIPTKIIPGLYEIVSGRVNLTRIRNIAIEDLLRREPVTLDENAISRVVRGRTVLVTGAGGSIGAELCRQVCRFDPRSLILVEQAENNLFQIHRELSEHFPQRALVPSVGDICDEARMEWLFRTHKPDVVFHAAAHKHVPMMEWNPGEAVKNNILGTRMLADIADRHQVREFVMISTDKAVNPTSIMGASKRIAEMYIQALSQRSQTKFVTVRFGNVLGSAGSVVPIFQEQIARGGPVTVTHPEMKRYFMTIPEACMLVLQAATMGRGGEIFILDMGEPVRILDLCHDLLRLSGYKPGEDIPIEFTGIRPGEKLFEEFAFDEEKAERTGHPKIFVGRFVQYPWETVRNHIQNLAVLVDSDDGEGIRRSFMELVEEYRPTTVPLPTEQQSATPNPPPLPHPHPTTPYSYGRKVGLTPQVRLPQPHRAATWPSSSDD